VPLIGQLSNRQFHTKVDGLVNTLDANMPVRVRATALCRCGCRREVAAGRKFLSQAYYNMWLSRERIVGGTYLASGLAHPIPVLRVKQGSELKNAQPVVWCRIPADHEPS
jgi:hypothetical protein